MKDAHVEIRKFECLNMNLIYHNFITGSQTNNEIKHSFLKFKYLSFKHFIQLYQQYIKNIIKVHSSVMTFSTIYIIPT